MGHLRVPSATWFGSLVGFALWLAASPAAALDFELRAGLKGGLSGQGATEVVEDSDQLREDEDPDLLGLAGAGPGGGPVVEFKLNRAVGLETGFYFTDDSSRGSNTIRRPNGELKGELSQTQNTAAHHVPLLLKLSPSFEQIRPVLGLGLEFVGQRSAELSYGATGDVESSRPKFLERRNVASPTAYTLFQFTAGAEFDAGPVRIPLELRGGWNLGWEESFDARIEVTRRPNDTDRFEYDAAYLAHFGLFVGVLYTWEFDV